MHCEQSPSDTWGAHIRVLTVKSREVALAVRASAQDGCRLTSSCQAQTPVSPSPLVTDCILGEVE